ncbi:MCE family protein [Pseudonocardia sp. CA-107938]|uniref:MCE family protein n=1 Tax=Pseudonocardia sp. CA-107938 TaxID=3240021 RepID=UPI003D8B55A4
MNTAGRIARGVAAAAAILVAAGVTVAASAGAFDRSPTVTSSVQIVGSPIRPESAVQFRGVRVGRLAAVEPEPGGQRSRLVMRMDADALGRIPRGAAVRILPLTLFGDQVVDLAPPAGGGPVGIVADTVLPADDSRETVALYTAYSELYDLLNRVQPAKIQAVLTALADALRGRGTDLGVAIDQLHRSSAKLDPLLETIGPGLDTVSGIGDKLAAAAPDLVATLDDATTVSRFLVDRRDDIAGLLAGGIELSDETTRLLADNHDTAITVIRSGDAVAGVLAEKPTGFPDVFDTAAGFGEVTRGLSNRTDLSATLTVERVHSYTPRDCPRYGHLAGPNCGDPGGTVGGVGSAQEADALRQVAPADGSAESGDGLRGVLLGPMLRGTTVETP